jgi:DUF1680 family protein
MAAQAAASTAAPVVPTAQGRLTPLALTAVQVTDGFWRDRQELNRESIIPHCDQWLEKVGWVENFRAAVRGTLGQDRVGRLFTDSEIYKTLEAMAWETARQPSEAMEERIAELARLLAQAQDEDGYLDTFYGYEGGPSRYSDLELGHELYCMGHLIQAGVARLRAGVDDELVAVARRAADHICRQFGPEGNQGLCGHPEIETALVELYRVTGERRYLDQARLFVDRRGHRTLADTMTGGRDYYQDDVPVREAPVLVGHAVRALYLAAGAVDVAVETGDAELLDHLVAQFDRTVARRTYLTGGMGSHHHGETFGDDFELPADRAYAETCAGIASVMVAWRLLLATGESRYADLIERTLYNIVATSPSTDGSAFYYVNTMHRRTPGIEPDADGASLRRTDGVRAPWFTTSCCPTNVARTLASLSAYVATSDADGVQVHQYVPGRVDVQLGQGRRAVLEVTTDYPFDGTVTVRVVETDGEPWTLSLRVPAWSATAAIERGDVRTEAGPGYAQVEHAWQAGDEIRLSLDVRPRVTTPDPRIDAVRGCVAVERGPLVYCLESVDNPQVDLDEVEIDLSEPLGETPAPAGTSGPAVVATGRTRPVTDAVWPYGEPAVERQEARSLVLTPYYGWANRGSSQMRVFLPRAAASGD